MSADLKGDARLPRSVDTRSSDERPKAWRPPSILPDPHPTEDWTFRWIRKSTLNDSDEANVSLRLREGWQLVIASEHPEVVAELQMPVSPKGHIEVGGLLLAKMPREVNDQMRAYYERQTQAQSRSIEEQLGRENDARMPMLKPSRRSQVTFGGGIR